ncbi:MAG TPA: error-prone DNA polymerase [Chthoniobacterales bacterium]|nr:error-prone DNA polymerase [Chthoniobacterales bacterium]
MSFPNYVELHARSAFSFLRGSSSPEHLAFRAAELQLPALALCDRDGVFGAPRFYTAAQECGIRPIVGSELTMEDGSVLPVLVQSQKGYQNLCRLLSQAKLRSPKNESSISWSELSGFAEGLICLTGDEEGPLHQALGTGDFSMAEKRLDLLKNIFGAHHLFVEIQRHALRTEQWLNRQLCELAERHSLKLLATNGVLYGTHDRRTALDVFTCARNHTHLDAAGRLLEPNAERHLKDYAAMTELFSDLPHAIANTVAVANEIEFTLNNLGYQFPKFPVPTGEDMDSFLEKQVWKGAQQRYSKITERIRSQINRELALIRKLEFPGYFLIVWDLVRYCRESNIMVQGRGSAANSAVCYSLGITAVDPIGGNLLFERFLSEGRKGWPDIDLDLPSGDRREQVIQEVYRRYGRSGAAMTANVITFRGRSAMRETGKALNLPEDVMDRFSRLYANGDFPHTLEAHDQLKQAGLPSNHPRVNAFLQVYCAIYGLPRHLGQHSGGMVICEGQLDTIVPLENATMPGRTVIQWDKDDCEDLGIVKVDLLGLGMMAALQDAIEICNQRGHPVDLAALPKDDPATYDMLCKADTIGVFQVESRAQMATLPRMKPREFYDLVIEVAIIRPGPIQGHLMHPYLARREGIEAVTYLDPRLTPVLERTLGVPLFQEQMLKIAMVMANFSGDEAEELRRALSYHRSQERMQRVETKLRSALRANGVKDEVAEKILAAITSFALYGFPESHAISFALITYASSWLKVHRPAEFFVGLLNNQPMGFYSPATLIKDAQRGNLKIRSVSITHSEWLCTVESDQSIRLGFCLTRGINEIRVQQMVKTRKERSFTSIQDFRQRTFFERDELRILAKAGALNPLAEHRRDALWSIEGEVYQGELFFDTPSTSPLGPMQPVERLEADFDTMHLTIGPHPMAYIRESLPKDIWRSSDLPFAENGSLIRVAGLAICRQRPGTAKGFVFISLEDETGISNVIVPPRMFEKNRLTITQETFLLIEGIFQIRSNVIHIRAKKIERLPAFVLETSDSHDFH